MEDKTSFYIYLVLIFKMNVLSLLTHCILFENFKKKKNNANANLPSPPPPHKKNPTENRKQKQNNTETCRWWFLNHIINSFTLYFIQFHALSSTWSAMQFVCLKSCTADDRFNFIPSMSYNVEIIQQKFCFSIGQMLPLSETRHTITAMTHRTFQAGLNFQFCFVG